MEESMKFNSSVCTSIEQSQRLLKLGLNPETADMHHYKWSEGYWDIYTCPPRGSDSCYIPAWSLHRLLCMLDYDNAATFDIMPNLAYEDVIATITLRIGCGAFNKEYLSYESKRKKYRLH